MARPAGLLLGAALTLVGTILAPLTPGGTSFLGVVAEVAERSWAEAGLFVLSFGGPWLFGLGLALAAAARGSALPRWLLHSALALFQAQLFLWSMRAWMAGFGVAPGALFGFSVVSAIYLMYFSAKAAAEGEGQGPTLRWLANWGALLVIAVAAWLRLQVAAGLRMGPALEIAVTACVLIMLATRRRRPDPRPA